MNLNRECYGIGWKRENTPALLDNTDGVKAPKLEIANKILSVGYSLQNQEDAFDFSRFTEEYIGASASEMCNRISIANVRFADGNQMRKMMTTLLNQHDELLFNLDKSGKAKEAGTKERRMEAWNDFCGPRGRNKNVALFYAFVLWDNVSITHLSRRLPEGKGADSEAGKSNKNDSSAKKRKKVIDLVESLVPSESIEEKERQKKYQELSMKYMEAKVEDMVNNQKVQEENQKLQQQKQQLEHLENCIKTEALFETFSPSTRKDMADRYKQLMGLK